MDDRVTKIIEEKTIQLQNLEKKIIENEEKKDKEVRNKKLIEWNLYKIVYNEDKKNNYEEYATYDMKKEMFYKKEPLEISDEEYKALLELDKSIKENKKKLEISTIEIPKNNNVQPILAAIGYLILFISIVTAIIAGAVIPSFTMFIYIFLSGFICAMIFIGLSEILKNVLYIKDKLDKR